MNSNLPKVNRGLASLRWIILGALIIVVYLYYTGKHEMVFWIIILLVLLSVSLKFSLEIKSFEVRWFTQKTLKEIEEMNHKIRAIEIKERLEGKREPERRARGKKGAKAE